MLTSIQKLPLFLACFTLFLLSICSLLVPSTVLASGEITVAVNLLNVRSGPGLEHDVTTQLSKGKTLKIEDEKDSWYKVNIDGQEGWVASWLVTSKAASGAVKQAQASVDRLNVRSGPGTSFQFVTQIRPEQSFPVIKEEGEWLQIQLNDTENGWVAKWLVDVTEQDISEATQLRKKAYVQATILNIRSEPSLNSSIVGKLNQGEELQILDVTQGWYKIKWGNEEGWVASEYVKEEETAADEKNTKETNNEKEDNGEATDGEASPSDTKKERLQVNVSILNVRASGSLDAKVIGKLQEGTVLEKIGQNGDWIEITYDNRTGWVAAWLVESVQEQVSNKPKVTILNNGTNLRSGPGTEYSVVQRVDQGEQFDILTTDGDWFQIALSNGQTAYVAGWIVSAEGLPNVHRGDLYDYLKGKKIVIDAGHGGKDNGATGSHFGTLEKVVNLQVAKLLQQKFTAAGAKTVMTRTSDRFLTLQQRVDVSIMEKADAFLSVHHNTNPDKSINGSITYYYKNTDRTLAQAIQPELVKANGMKNLNARKENFFVLRENPKPSVLIEVAFLSNYNDELTIRKSTFQDSSANGILNGVAKYFKEKGE